MDSDEEAEWVEMQAEEDEAAAALVLARQEEEAAISRNLKRLRQDTQKANAAEIFDVANVVADPGVRRPIHEYGTLEIRDKMRWAYLSRGRNRLIGHNFPKTKFGPDMRSFLDVWYTKYDWIEYSVEKDAAYCFHCFVFKSSSNISHFGHDVFTKKGFRNWKKASENFNSHVGGPNSIHNNARHSCEDFSNKKQSVAYAIVCQEEQLHINYEIRLRAVVGVVRFLLEQGLAFRGHDESSTSLNKGNFREMLDWYGARCKEVANVIDELDIYVDLMKRSPEFIACDSLSGLALKLVQKKHHLTFPLVYRLITLVLTLPVATAQVERVFSVMHIIKTDLRNKIGDDWLNNLMICYVEKEIFAKIDDKKIMLRFHSYNDRRGHLPRHFRLANMDST